MWSLIFIWWTNLKNILQCKQRDIPQNIDDEIQNFERESERDIEPMIEDGENVERNSSEEIESQGMYTHTHTHTHTHIYVEHMHILLKLYIYLLI